MKKIVFVISMLALLTIAREAVAVPRIFAGDPTYNIEVTAAPGFVSESAGVVGWNREFNALAAGTGDLFIPDIFGDRNSVTRAAFSFISQDRQAAASPATGSEPEGGSELLLLLAMMFAGLAITSKPEGKSQPELVERIVAEWNSLRRILIPPWKKGEGEIFGRKETGIMYHTEVAKE